MTLKTVRNATVTRLSWFWRKQGPSSAYRGTPMGFRTGGDDQRGKRET